MQTRELMSVSVTSSGLIAAIQGALGGAVFAAVGIDPVDNVLRPALMSGGTSITDC